jgi:hypothetical protein
LVTRRLMPSRHTYQNTGSSQSAAGAATVKIGSLDPVPGNAGQLNFEAVDCSVYAFEGHAAQVVLLGVLFRRCTIEHTNDVLPPERLWAVYRGLSKGPDGQSDIQRVFEVLGLLQELSSEPPDDYERKRRQILPAADNLAELRQFSTQAEKGMDPDTVRKRNEAKKKRTRGTPA